MALAAHRAASWGGSSTHWAFTNPVPLLIGAGLQWRIKIPVIASIFLHHRKQAFGGN